MDNLNRRLGLNPASLLTAVFLAAAVLALPAGCRNSGNRDNDTSPDADEVDLGIPDRAWAPGHDDVGWCGETCIQMAMAYYGHELPQEDINRAAGSPSDITEVDMDRALNALGVTFEAWDESRRDVTAFIEWIKEHLDNGHPVICGTKIYPDENPDWYVDHFVLAVGFDPDGMLVNTQLDCDGPQWIEYEQLASLDEGHSFQNDELRHFGRAIFGTP
jgi:hypothetical protein